MTNHPETEILLSSLLKLDRWIEAADWKAYDTFDGLLSPYATAITQGRPFLRQCWQQTVRRFPFNLRPLLGIQPATSSCHRRAWLSQGWG